MLPQYLGSVLVDRRGEIVRATGAFARPKFAELDTNLWRHAAYLPRSQRAVLGEFLEQLWKEGHAAMSRPVLGPTTAQYVLAYGTVLQDGEASIIGLAVQPPSPVDAAAEELLEQMQRNGLIHDRVLAYLPGSAQRRLARRIARSVMLKALRSLALRIAVTDDDLALGELGPHPSDGDLAWCERCQAERPTCYYRQAVRCARCRAPIRADPPGGRTPS